MPRSACLPPGGAQVLVLPADAHGKATTAIAAPQLLPQQDQAAPAQTQQPQPAQQQQEDDDVRSASPAAHDQPRRLAPAGQGVVVVSLGGGGGGAHGPAPLQGVYVASAPSAKAGAHKEELLLDADVDATTYQRLAQGLVRSPRPQAAQQPSRRDHSWEQDVYTNGRSPRPSPRRDAAQQQRSQPSASSRAPAGASPRVHKLPAQAEFAAAGAPRRAPRARMH